MEQTSHRPKIAAQFNEEFYWERVNRSLGWLGNSDEEQRRIQEAIKDVTIGLAGCGGIGGMAASRLGRLGVGKIKLADPDTFDVSNINRQVGASPTNKGRNKAEVVAEMVHEVTPDVDLEIYPEGIMILPSNSGHVLNQYFSLRRPRG